jgi:hypothetical protein
MSITPETIQGLLDELEGGEGQLPAKIRALIAERLAQTVNHECALVALFEGAATATRSSVYACLANLARQHGLDFFEQALSDAEEIRRSYRFRPRRRCPVGLRLD